MAEAVGIVAASLSLAKASKGIIGALRSLRHAPDEIMALNDEISDLLVLIANVQRLAQQDQTVDLLIRAPLQRAIICAEEISDTLGTDGRNPLFLAMGWQKSLDVFQSQLRNARVQIMSALSLFTA